MIDTWTIQRVRDAANIVDVMQELGFNLQRSGKEYKCLCPFHADRHIGSFKVSPAKNIYHCFSCQAHGDAVQFLIDYENLNFLDAIRWLGRKYGIEVEGAENFKSVRPSAPHQPPPPLPMLTIDKEKVKMTRKTIRRNNLLLWLASLPWDAAQRARIKEMYWLYYVGNWSDGRVVWWQVDEQYQVRTGKLMKYKDDGHRDKDDHPGWVHNYKNICANVDDYTVKKTLFGMHLTKRFPTASIHIVESEKTALIMAIAYGCPWDKLWVASGGKTCLNPEVLEPLIKENRRIMIYPDKDGVEEWKAIAKGIGYDNLQVNADYLTRYWKEEDGDHADLGDLMVRWLSEKKHPPRKALVSQQPKQIGNILEKMMEDNEALRLLVNKFNLTEDEH